MLSPEKYSISFEKPTTFFFHYNKPLSKQKGFTMISVHVKDTCYAVKNIHCEVKTHGKVNKRQPYFVMKGKLKTLKIIDNEAFIT